MPSDPYLGEIFMFAGTYAPRGYLFCEGQLLPINQYAALFSVLGVTYGGDGTRTFGLPDLRGRFPVGPGQGPGLSPYRPGQTGGSETVTLTTPQLPAHSHPVLTSGSAGAGAGVASSSGGTPVPGQATGGTGAGQPVPNLPPFLGVNFIIATEGLYPVRQ